jgi:hypothetical protein
MHIPMCNGCPRSSEAGLLLERCVQFTLPRWKTSSHDTLNKEDAEDLGNWLSTVDFDSVTLHFIATPLKQGW